ncbi:hypothetical protein QNH39_12450 [Neobacillus novalis]|uniref:Uncharacterized protein n=1 Tax=Neobacillus novalis TaxID=220687 RepID=A0AA95MQS9_9BACI|nr:hypothetical protein [Neobacillus novalis]WHY88594.1 hypothetical protein QNH39_12450 [Neobacillus novalis]
MKIETRTTSRHPLLPFQRGLSLPVLGKFWLSHGLALIWMVFSIVLSVPWVKELGQVETVPVAIVIN